MELLTRAFVIPVVQAVAFVLLFAAPLVLVGLWLNRERKREKAALLEPFTDLPRRPPGESLRKQIDKLAETLDGDLFVLTLTGAVSAGIVVGTPAGSKLLVGGTLLLINVASALFIAPRMKWTARKLRDYRLGFKGERVVGEELNKLMADGYTVYHDVPFNGFNIDHVIVGPAGIFSVETKTRSKHADAHWEEKATARFDGQSITFNDYAESDAVKQARTNAKHLARWLSSATGEQTSVGAVLVTPGWYVSDAPAIDNLMVRNPSRVRPFLIAMPVTVLPAQLQRIRHQLEQRCSWGDGEVGRS